MIRIDIKAHWTKYLEIFAVVISFISLFLLLANYALGGPLSSDVIAYMNVGINGIESPMILNRYFHIFFEEIFLNLAPTPLIGVQYFWAFLISGTCILVYIGARNFIMKSRPLHGLIAVALFLSIDALANYAGIALVDITAMFMLAILIVVYIASTRNGHRLNWIIMLFGFLCFLAFKTKETTLSVLVLMIGFGFSRDTGFDWKVLLRRLLYWLLGFIAGGVFFAMLNWIFLGDPLFGFRISDIRGFFQTYINVMVNWEKASNPDNWYTAFLFTSLLVPFVLYLISGIKSTSDPDIGPELRIIWIVPLAVVFFLTITISNQQGYNSRFILPSLPIICLLGPQFLNLNLKALSTHNERISAIVLVFLGLALLVCTRLVLRYFIPKTGWDIGAFLEVVFVPILLSVILGVTIYLKQVSLRGSLLIMLTIIAIVTIPMARNIKYVSRKQPNLDAARNLLYPFSSFSDQIQYEPSMLMYIGKNAWEVMGVSALTKDRNEISALFNIYFKANSSKDNFALSSDLSNMADDLLSTPYTYGLLSLNEWQNISKDPITKSLLEQKYQVYFENKQLLVLLKGKATAEAIPTLRPALYQTLTFRP